MLVAFSKKYLTLGPKISNEQRADDDKRNEALERDIKLGLRDETGADGSRVEVVSGLNAGDRIVATNLGSLRAGSTVRVIAATQR